MKILPTSTFGHKDNIIKMIKKYAPFISDLNDVDFYIGGGFAAAILFAPRDETGESLQENYFSDIDIFFQDKKSFYKTAAIMESSSSFIRVSTTDNAYTYEYLSDSGYVTVQCIKKYLGSPEEIVKTFDILNVGVFYNPKTDTWNLHDKAISSTVNKTLATGSTPLLDHNNPQFPDTIFFQLERFAKYQERYGLSLSPEIYFKLVQLYKEFPDLSYEKNEKVRVRGYYSTYSRLVSKTFNVWQAFSFLFVDNEGWDFFGKDLQAINDGYENQSEN